MLTPALALLLAANPLGQTTLEQRIAGGERANGFSFLSEAPGEDHVVREDLAKAGAQRTRRRESLTYFAQLTDFQIADEESPARVEASDPFGGAVSSAWRPQEALLPHIVDQHLRQVNALSRSPLEGSEGRLGFAILTGDNADSMQRNETDWVRVLLAGGRLDPNSGPIGEGPVYTGFQDYDDSGQDPGFYDPDEPMGTYAGWPTYPGLMDAAQKPFTAAGLDVPAYVSFGNHDSLVQGNEDALAAFEAAGIGPVKPYRTGPRPVPADTRRQFVDKAQYKAILEPFGFARVDPAENAASASAAGYYTFSPKPGLRLIALDTVSEGGVVGPSADGNLDDPQFRWLERRLQAASDADELVIVYGHHSIQSLVADVPDEAAQACTADDSHGHDVNPGCDRDPRASTPIHLGADLRALLLRFPHVVAFVAGHSHVNDVVAFKDGDRGFWNIRTSAEADWPHQQRLIEVLDNRDGTLSVFATIFDHAGPIAAPPSGTSAGDLAPDALASIGRTLGYNDPQAGGGTGEGRPSVDRNVELLVADPRRSAAPLTPSASRRLRLSVRVTPRRIPLRRRTRVTFFVTSGGTPVRSALVRFAGRGRRTDARGRVRFTVRLVRARSRPVIVTRTGYRRARTSVRSG